MWYFFKKINDSGLIPLLTLVLHERESFTAMVMICLRLAKLEPKILISVSSIHQFQK